MPPAPSGKFVVKETEGAPMISRNLMFTFTAMSALVLSMGLAYADDISDNTMWCSKVTKPSNVVICSEPELRRLLIIRDKIFMDAKANFSPADVREMNAEQNNWVHEYTARCGADIDGPPVRFPVRRDIIECFKREARERIAELIGDMRESFPTYQMPKVDGSITYMYQDAQRLDQQGQQHRPRPSGKSSSAPKGPRDLSMRRDGRRS